MRQPSTALKVNQVVVQKSPIAARGEVMEFDAHDGIHGMMGDFFTYMNG